MQFTYLLLGIIVGCIFTVFYEFCFKQVHKKVKKEPIVRFKGLHLHHSLYGLIFLALFVIFYNFFLLGMGFGIIIRHTQTEKKFTFIDKS